jgi:hypothetical protein
VCVCVCVAVGIQHSVRVRRIPLSLWPVRLYSIYLHYHKTARFSKKENLLNIKYVFRCSLQCLSENFSPCKKKQATYDQKYVLDNMQSTRYSYQIFMYLFKRQLLEK